MNLGNSWVEIWLSIWWLWFLASLHNRKPRRTNSSCLRLGGFYDFQWETSSALDCTAVQHIDVVLSFSPRTAFMSSVFYLTTQTMARIGSFFQDNKSFKFQNKQWLCENSPSIKFISHPLFFTQAFFKWT